MEWEQKKWSEERKKSLKSDKERQTGKEEVPLPSFATRKKIEERHHVWMKKGGDRQQISKIVKKMSDGNQYEEVQNPHNKIKINNDEKDSYDRMVRRHVGGDNI